MRDEHVSGFHEGASFKVLLAQKKGGGEEDYGRNPNNSVPMVNSFCGPYPGSKDESNDTGCTEVNHLVSCQISGKMIVTTRILIHLVAIVDPS